MSDKINSDFRCIIEREVNEFVSATRAFQSNNMNILASLVNRAFTAQHDFIIEGIGRLKPADDNGVRHLADETFALIQEIQDMRNKNAEEEYRSHVATIAESICALSWVTMPNAPVQFIRDMKEAGDYFGNRVLTANKGNEQHATWINKWNAILSALEEYVKNHHRSGFAWNATHKIPGDLEFPFVPPPPPPPPGMSYGAGDSCNAPVIGDEAFQADRQQLLLDINQGLGITRRLRTVDRDAPIPAGALHIPRATSRPIRGPLTTVTHPPIFLLEGKKWRVEYIMNVDSNTINPNDKSESLAMFKCANSYVETKAKMNAVTIDSCKRCVVILRDIISSVELIRCERVEVRCIGSCPNVTLDNCDSVQVFLSDLSVKCEVITSNSTSTNVCRLTADGDYVEFPVPEQIRSVLVEGRLLSSVVEHHM